MTLQYAVDRSVMRDGQIFAYGWGFYPGTTIVALTLRLEFENGAVEEVDAQYGGQRDDVKNAFGTISEAENAGFLVLAGLNGRRLTSAVLRWDITGKGRIETALELAESNEESTGLTRFAYYRMLSRKALALIRTAGARTLWRKIRSYIANRPRAADEDKWVELLQKTAGKPLCVVVDHDLGGGANIYRNEFIAQRLGAGETVLLLSFHVATLQYFVEYFDQQTSCRYSLADLDALLPLAAIGQLKQIVYNCAVSFRSPLDVPEFLMTLQQQSGAPLLFLVHDYFAICPSHFLIDSDEVFCGVPAEAVCNACLLKHRDGFVSFSGAQSIQTWRTKWGAALNSADEIRVFSESSWAVLQRAYPALAAGAIRLVPHKLHTSLARLEVAAGNGLHIGVVGIVGRHKGASIVAELAAEILRRNSNVKISVIGTLEVKVPGKLVQVSGAYEAEQLPAAIKSSGANIFLFPSIWGETFSYTSHELVAMGLPFACFDFGAQADLARSYKRGLILKSMDAAVILDRLQEFWLFNYSLSESTQ